MVAPTSTPDDENSKWGPAFKTGRFKIFMLYLMTLVGSLAWMGMYIGHMHTPEALLPAANSHSPLDGTTSTLQDDPGRSARFALMRPLPDPTLPKLCVIARTYSAQTSALALFMLALANNESPIQIFLAVTEASQRTRAVVQNISSLVNSLVAQNLSTVLPFTSADGLRIFKATPDHQDYGYALTDLSLDYVLNQEFSCDYVSFTNGDNLYAKNFVSDKLLPFMIAGDDMLGTSFVSHYRWPEAQPEDTPLTWADGTNTIHGGAFHLNQEDLGAGLWRTAFLRATGQRFLGPALRAQSMAGVWSAVNPFDGLPPALMVGDRVAARESVNQLLFTSDGWFYERTALLTANKTIVNIISYFHQ